MKLFLLKVLLQRRARDEGFTLPIVIAIGLIMVLLGTVNIMTAGEENLNVISDNSKKKALAIADVGISRYRQLLDKNRMLMVYDRIDWSSVTGTCDINTSDEDYDPDVVNIHYFTDTSQWHTVNDGTENIGQYRIINYIYDIDDDVTDNINSSTNHDDDGLFAPNDDRPNSDDIHTFNDADYNPRGILIIQSKANDDSEAQVKVEIPIRINENDMNNISPALWIGDSSTVEADIDDVIIDGNRNNRADGDTATGDTTTDDGNIVISKPANGSTAGCDEPEVLNGNRVVYDPRPLPTVIPELNGSTINDTDLAADIDSNTDNRYVRVRGENNQEEWMLLLGAVEASPRDRHKIWRTDDNGIEYFYYKAPAGLEINNDEKLAVDGQSRAILYVDGDITLTGNADLQAGSRFSRSFSSTGLQVYVKEGDPADPNDITINPGAGNTVRIKGLIHAPHSTVNITGGGTVLVEGAMWVKDWNNTGGANVRIIPDNTSNNSGKAYLHYIGTDIRAAKPITDAVTEWEIQEVE